MAQTTTAVNACDVVIKMDNASNVLTDISGSSNQCSIDLSNDTGEASTFGSRWKITKSCKSSAKMSLQILYTTAADEALKILKDWYFTTRGSKTVQVDVPDSTVGNDRYAGEWILENLSIPITSDEAAPIMVSASLSNDGEITATTIAS